MRRALTWGPALVLAAAIAGGASAAPALWAGQAHTDNLVAGQAAVGFAVTKDAVEDAATASTDTVQFTIGEAEATALQDAGADANGDFAVAVPFDVTMLTSAGYGMDYTIDIAAPTADTVFGLPGGPVFFLVSDPSGCTVDAAGTATPYTPSDPVTGLAPGVQSARTQVDHWCLVYIVTPPSYSTNAVAGGTNLVENPESSVPDAGSMWLAYLIPDPAAEPALAITLTPVPVTPQTA